MTEVGAQRIASTVQAISQPYGKHVTPIGPFVYRLDDKSPQYGIAHSTERRVTLVSYMESSPIRPLTSPAIHNSNDEVPNSARELRQQSVPAVSRPPTSLNYLISIDEVTNHFRELHEPSVSDMPTDTRHSTHSGNKNNNASSQEAFNCSKSTHC